MRVAARVKTVVLAGVMTLAGGAALSLSASAQVRVVDQAAAVVNGTMIPRSEVEKRAAPDLARLEREGRLTEAIRSQLMKRALDDLIIDNLLGAEQREVGIEVSDQDVDLAIEDIRKQNHMDPETFEKALGTQGMNMFEYRERIKRELASMKLLGQKVRSKIKVSDADVAAEYQKRAKAEQKNIEIHARQIVVKVAQGASAKVEEKARVKAAGLASRIRSGEDFGALARKYSDSPSKEQGGDVGFFKRGEMVPAFDKAAFSLADGEVSDPVRTAFGWHVINVIERREIEVPELDSVKDQIREALTQDRMRAQTESYLQGLRQKASVEILMPELKP